jgi:FtsP/CotA-like multicopper oxidase with cupredoxin domain
MGARPLRALGRAAALAIAAALAAPAALAEVPQQVADLLSVQGDRAVAVIRFEKGQTRELAATVGMKLFAWDKIRTSPGSVVRIRYLDGSTMLVGRDS